MTKSKKYSKPLLILLWAGLPLSLAAGYGVGLMNREGGILSGQLGASSKKGGGKGAEETGAGKPKAEKKGAQAGTAFGSQREWVDRIRSAGTSDFPAMWKEIMGISDQYQRRAPRELLYMKWVTVDPAGLMEFLGKEDNGQRVQAMTAWLRHDVDGAYAWALSGDDPAKINESARMVFQQLAQLDPKKFLALAASAKEEHLPGESIQAAFRKFGKTDPNAAVEALRALGPKARSNGSYGLGVEWARTDPGSAFAWAQQLTDPVDKQSALRGVLASWGRTDPEAAIAHLDLLQKMPEAKGQDPKAAIIRGLAAKDPLKAMDFAIAHAANPNERMNLIGGEVIPKLAASMKPVEFAALMDKVGTVKGPPGSPDISYSEALLTRNDGYQRYPGPSSFPEDPDPAGAFRQLTGGNLSAAQKLTATAMAQQWAEKDTPGALAAYQSATNPAVKEMLNRALLGRAQSEGDLTLLATIGNDIAGDSSYWVDDIVRRQASADPAKVLTWLDQLPEGSRMRTPALSSAVGAWASYDTGRAIEYVQQLPASEQPELYRTISNTWASADTYGNSQWVASLPEGTNRDYAASALISQLAAKEPESALAWARSVADPDMQMSSYQNLFMNWSRRDSTAAMEALQTENLAPEQRSRLEAMMQRNRGR